MQERQDSLDRSRSETPWYVFDAYNVQDIDPAMIPVDLSIQTTTHYQDQREHLPEGTEFQALVGQGGLPKAMIYPMAFRQLPFELAKVRFGDIKDATGFALRWGLLGFQRYRELVASVRWDPLWFIWWHARSVRDVLNIHAALQDNDPEALAKVLDTILQPATVDPGVRLSGHHIRGPRVVRLQMPDDDSVEDQGLNIIGQFVNPNIAGIRMWLFPRTTDKFPNLLVNSPLEKLSPVYSFNSLAEAIWWHLSTFVAGAHPVGQCKECGSLFERTDKRQEFCPPPQDHINEARSGVRNRAQSLCALKSRSRRRRRGPQQGGDDG